MDRAKELDLATQIKDVMISVLELNIGREQLDEKVSLYSPIVGLDSLSLLHILVAIEKRFDIEIDDEDVMSAELRNVGSLVHMISGVIDAKGH
ncbi:acyl carrier protein [Actinomadura darangshiensis]|uniref:Acyl carrier protein n=1 Tax=Actinomadura darangshiensis TaxID=705336 RepID=A0A4V2YW94_9ACTN|nr:acyl carrier protein [Actinomadura darangshiensis]TDD84517.1 acyl carrier protein [Actinomadura darangshiensis]